MASDAKLLSNFMDSVIPDHGGGINAEMGSKRKELIEKGATTIVNKEAAKELAKLKLQEKRRLQREADFDSRKTKAVEDREKTIEAIEVLQSELASPVTAILPSKLKPGQARRIMAAQSTTRADVAKMLTSLNINLNLQLTKQDTANLLACLLTCNEHQLQAIYKNNKVPIAVKTVIKRLLDDAKLGNIDTVERLWDRVFGKNPLTLNLPESQQQQTGIIPNMPVSREAYIIIRDTLTK